MTLLDQKIADRIRLEGPISFETFMDMALFDPQFGYYRRESVTVGREGDFYTSSHLHEIFGFMIGRQIEEMWEVMGRPPRFTMVEIGAGMGYMAKDLLTFLKKQEIYPSFRYVIVEMSDAAKKRQEELLRQFSGSVEWVADIGNLHSITGCFFSNELLDAFPVRLIEMHGELKEVFVDVREGSFQEITKLAGNEIVAYFRDEGIMLPEGYRTEVNLRMKEWLWQVSAYLSEGFVLTVDYGYPGWEYYSEERNRGTLLCYNRHQVSEDPYIAVGDQDITAHVNFSALRRWGEDAGLKTLGYAPQGGYLVSLGIDEIISECWGSHPEPFDLARIKGLLLPEGMGESHKVMIQYKGSAKPELRGFRMRNHMNNL